MVVSGGGQSCSPGWPGSAGRRCLSWGGVGVVVGVWEHLGPSSNTTWSHRGGGTCFALSWSLALLNLAHPSADLGVFWKMKPSISHSSFTVKGGYSFQSQAPCSVMILPKPRSSHELSPRSEVLQDAARSRLKRCPAGPLRSPLFSGQRRHRGAGHHLLGAQCPTEQDPGLKQRSACVGKNLSRRPSGQARQHNMAAAAARGLTGC